MKGKVLYVADNYARRGALNARVGAYQNDQEMACTIITSDSGYFELTGLDTGVYDIVYITDSLYMSIKLPDVTISEGINYTRNQYEQIDEELWSYTYEDLEDETEIYIRFKDSVSDQASEELISESRCTIVDKPFVEGLLVLEIPAGELVDCVVKWFLSKNMIADAEFSTTGFLLPPGQVRKDNDAYHLSLLTYSKM